MNTTSLALTASILMGSACNALAAEPAGPGDGRYLYIEQFSVPPGRTINSAIAEGKQWVRVMRESGHFDSVRLYLHHTGPEPAIYIHAEPKNWAAIEPGIDAPIEKLDLMNKPFNWSAHSDNVLSEIAVE